MTKSVLVFTWDDYCNWWRSKDDHIMSDLDQLDPHQVIEHFSYIQIWHKELIEKYHKQYKIEFCDSRNGFIVFGKRK
jgi:hypothetical protein